MNWIIAIGLIAATLTTLCQIPQFLKSWRTKKTRDISLETYSLLTLGTCVWLLYGILIKDLPLIAANIITTMICASILYLKIKHG